MFSICFSSRFLQITQLKIDNNPFAKGFRDPSPSDIERWVCCNDEAYKIYGLQNPKIFALKEDCKVKVATMKKPKTDSTIK